MSDNSSKSLIVAWRISELEARNLKAPEIEPIHLFLGLAKAVDVDPTDLLKKKTPGYLEVLEELLREFRRVRKVFLEANVDPKVLRRRLRQSLPKNRISLDEEGMLHRSEAAKKIFFDAGNFAEASGGAIYPVHLLLAILAVRDEKRASVFDELAIDGRQLLKAARAQLFLKKGGGSMGGSSKRSFQN